MPVTNADEIRAANTRYHDLAASHYDSKWGIYYGELGRSQVDGEAAQGARRGARAGSRAGSRSAPAPATSASTSRPPE